MRKRLLAWFHDHQRDLPWRRTYEPYQVWIAEIMLQQTQMDRVVEYFLRWMQSFPDIATLAEASEQSILKAWEGLGYYSRARNIRKTASLLVEKHGTAVPDEYEQLIVLPGIGPYTAAAILSIAFNKSYPVIDANVERLFSRLEDIGIPMKEKAVQESLRFHLEELLLDAPPRDVNQGLMELGALVCTPGNPDCSECPLKTSCRALSAGTVARRPVKKPKPQTIAIDMACTIIKRDGKYYIQQRRAEDVWGGLWEFPGGRIKEGETPAEGAVREFLEETEVRVVDLRHFATVVHYYTRYRVTLHSFLGIARDNKEPKLHAAQKGRWVSLEEMAEYAFPAGHRMVIEKLQKKGA